MRKFSRGDLYFANLNPVIGSEQGGCRPVLILQNNVGNYFSPTVIVASVSSRPDKESKLPIHCYIQAVEGLKQFSGTGIIQTMILRGEHEGTPIDNTTPEEIEALVKAYKEINPREIMIYSLDRSTPEEKLKKVGKEELEEIGTKIERATGIPVSVSA